VKLKLKAAGDTVLTLSRVFNFADDIQAPTEVGGMEIRIR
jgi:hypothetical protein